MAIRSIVAIVVALVAGVFSLALAPADEAPCPPPATACAPPSASVAPSSSAAPRIEQARLLFFFGEGCARCAEAEPLVRRLSDEGVSVEWIEIRHDAAGLARYREIIERLNIQGAGIPLFVVGDRFVVGYRGAPSETEVRELLSRSRDTTRTAITLPIVGRIDPARVSFPMFTVIVGLLDGINPCAIYVLAALLGILLHVRSRGRLILFGATFVVMSGVVYFLFMTAWVRVFLFAGVSRAVTIVLGAALVVMGLVNLKELVWFKKGPSLMIPDRAKPGLFRRMRAIAGAARPGTAFLGIAALAFLVNLVELGCTLGLPAIYTRILSLRYPTAPLTRLLYLAFYNVLYVVPLALVVAVFAVTFRKISLSERAAKVLKGISGALLVAFGLLFTFAPGVLQ